MFLYSGSILYAVLGAVVLGSPHPVVQRSDEGLRADMVADRRCESVGVAILGAGVAGITAAQALANQSLDDFVIVEYNNRIGGRVRPASFGRNPVTGLPYTIELGANWVEGTSAPHGLENPIWTLVKKWEVISHYSNYSNILTYNETGSVDYTHLLAEYATKYETLAVHAGEILDQNLQDQSARAGLSLAGWKPGKNMAAQAVEWWSWDWETAQNPETSSLVFGIAARNMSFVQFSAENRFVTDQRGYSSFIESEAATFLEEGDARLRLNTVVREVEYSDDGVTISNTDGTCLHAAYAISTFSAAVLQNDSVRFTPALPPWKRTAVEMTQTGTYTKIFMQFERCFWPGDTEFFLYASPWRRGYYPMWQSLSAKGFHPGSNILFVTVVGEEAYRVEAQAESQTRAEMLQVLREMFPDADVPEPVAFLFPRWSQEPWALGSYTNWPIGMSLEMHQNLRANVGRLWFAGEMTSAQYAGLLQGAWFEGREAGMRIAGLLRGECLQDEERCGVHKHYERLHGSSPAKHFNGRNGWPDLAEGMSWQPRPGQQQVLRQVTRNG